jgi:alpha-tubulin suppressor-like RCC1 family protein
MSAGTVTARRAVLRRWVMPTVVISFAAGLAPAWPAASALAASQGGSSIAAGGYHSCALESGKAYCWGLNDQGQLGNGSGGNDGDYSNVPVAVETGGVLTGKTLTQISAGGDGTCVLDSSGAAYCWGTNGQGQLGDGSTTAYSSVPVAVDTSGVLAGKTLTQISVGNAVTCALDSSGTAYCWGRNDFGQAGGGYTSPSVSVPVAVDTLGALSGQFITQISSGWEGACALDAAGEAYCWGINDYQQLGNGSTAAYSSVPVAVDTSGVLAGKTLNQVSVNYSSACALDSTGKAYCWGTNNVGQLGDGSTSSSGVPVAVDTSGVLAGKTLTQVTVAQDNACALDSTGAAYCWGFDGSGQLGDDAPVNSDSTVPVAVHIGGVLAGKTLTQISGGQSQVCALDTADAVYCWGSGYLGDNSPEPFSTVPVLTGPQAPTGVTATPGNATAKVSWKAPTSLDGGTLTGYTATATPGGTACATTRSTTCTIAGLTGGTTYSITVVAHTTVGDSGASAPTTVIPLGGPAFTSGSADTAAFGAAFTYTVTAAGDPTPKITSSGRLPSGVRFADKDDGTATIFGTPDDNAAGVYSLTLTARNRTGKATQEFFLTITKAPAITEIGNARAKVGVRLRLAIRASGYPSPALSESGSLPGGVSFTDNGNGTAVITGTPAAGSAGSYPIAITATNTSGTAARQFTITVIQPPFPWPHRQQHQSSPRPEAGRSAAPTPRQRHRP